MKATFLFTALALGANALFAQITNPGFETWTDGEPEGWTTTNAAGTSVTQSSDAHEGSSSAQLDVVTVQGFNFGGSMTCDFPITAAEPALHGWYKANFVSGDVLNVTVAINDDATDAVQAGAVLFDQSAEVWTEFVVNLTTVSANTPASGNISILLMGPGGAILGIHQGTTAKVDDLSWGEQQVGVAEASAEGFAIERIFPNPSNGDVTFVQYHTDRATSVHIQVVDLSGRPVLEVLNTVQGPGRYRAEIPASELAAGQYFVRILTDSGSFAVPFVR